MSGTANGLALRDDRAPVSVPAGALAIEADQTSWTTMQSAAFGQLGIADAPEGDKQVFLHVSQRTGLDPFAKQIYMIGRKDKKSEKRGNQWVDVWSVKYSIQTGIEGFRVIRGRAERAEGIRGILSRPVFYNGEGQEFKVWFFKQPPVAVEMTYTVRDRNGVETPYTSILRFDEYRQTRKDGEQQVSSGQWATKPVHMLEKCTEADVYRKAFPQDFSGVDLEDAMPLPDPDAPPVQPERQRVTAADARARSPQTVTATVVTPDASPAGTETTPHSAPSAAPSADVPPAGEAPRPRLATTGQAGLIRKAFERLTGVKDDDETPDQRKERLRQTSRLARVPYPGIGSTSELTSDQARDVREALARCETAADLEALLDSGALADDPRGQDGAVPGE